MPVISKRITIFILLFMGLSFQHATLAASKTEIDIEVKSALKRFKKEVDAADEYMKVAKGMLVFPSVFKAGFGIGGEYGEGAMLIGGKTVDYYNTAAASIGFQLGAQSKTIIMIFTTDKALSKFRDSEGWEAGVDGSVALVELGAARTFDTNTLTQPIIAFIISNKGLMYNLSLEGTKFTKIKK